MNPEIQDKLDIIIGNRFHEYGHPFKFRSAGMEDFASLPDLIKDLDDNNYLACLSEAEKLFEAHICTTCSIKLLLFLMILTKERFPEKYLDYEMRYNRLDRIYQSESRYFRKKGKEDKFYRDFKLEVEDAMNMWGGSCCRVL
jgi:hypothetical protein